MSFIFSKMRYHLPILDKSHLGRQNRLNRDTEQIIKDTIKLAEKNKIDLMPFTVRASFGSDLPTPYELNIIKDSTEHKIIEHLYNFL